MMKLDTPIHPNNLHNRKFSATTKMILTIRRTMPKWPRPSQQDLQALLKPMNRDTSPQSSPLSPVNLFKNNPPTKTTVNKTVVGKTK